MDNLQIGGENVEKLQKLAIMEEEDEEEISVPNWLIDVLKWITRMEMANSSLSFSCKLFNRLCWPKLHGNVEPHIVSFLEFCYEPNEFGNICGILKDQHKQIIPIAAIAPPEYILGFERIFICFLDTRVIEFFKNIALEEINMLLEKRPKNDEQPELISNLLTIFGRNIYGLDVINYNVYRENRRFSKQVKANRFLEFNRQFPTFIEQVSYLCVIDVGDLELDIFFNWLMKPQSNGRQKLLSYSISYGIERCRETELRFINRIKEEFTHSTERTIFLIMLEDEDENKYDQFSLENEQTGEVLNLNSQIACMGLIRKSYLARYPKGDEHWKEEAEKKFICQKGKTNIRLKIDEIEKK